jgi:hypothetical protein
VNILNKKSRTADKGWYSNLSVGEGLITHHRKRKKLVTKCYIDPRNWTDSLKRPRQWKMRLRFGTWNGRSLYGTGLLKTVAG